MASGLKVDLETNRFEVLKGKSNHFCSLSLIFASKIYTHFIQMILNCSNNKYNKPIINGIKIIKDFMATFKSTIEGKDAKQKVAHK